MRRPTALTAALILIAAAVIGFGLFVKPPLDVPLIWIGIALLAMAVWAWWRSPSKSSVAYDNGNGGHGGWGGGSVGGD